MSTLLHILKFCGMTILEIVMIDFGITFFCIIACIIAKMTMVVQEIIELNKRKGEVYEQINDRD